MEFVALPLLLVLLALGVPVGIAILASSALALIAIGVVPLETLIQRLVAGVDFFPLLAIPFFILMGQLMNAGGITEVLVRFAKALVGHLRGGLAHVNIVTSIILAGMSGSAVADASASSSILIPAMERAGYPRKYAAAVTGASAIIGPIIPPSIPMVLFAAITGESVGKLFLGGAIPGLVMGAYLLLVSYLIARARGYRREERASLVELGRSFMLALPALLTPVIVLGGILGGIVSPTEAAAAASVYAFAVGTLVYRGLTLRALPRLLLDVALYSAVVLFIIAAASPYGWVLAWLEVPQQIVALFLGISESPLVILFIICGCLLVLGMVVESAAILILVTPTLMPLIAHLGIDPIHFGVVLVLTLMIGTLTPPVGVVLYAIMNVGRVSMEALSRELVPYFLALVAALVTIILLPDLVLFLPELVYAR